MEKTFTVLISIIAAIILLGVVFYISGLLNIKEKTVETVEQDIINKKARDFCPYERLSEEMIFLQLNGDCGRCEDSGPPPCNPFCNDASPWYVICQDDRPEGEVTMADHWKCDVPSGGNCMITKISHYQWVYNSCKIASFAPILGFNDYRIYNGTDTTGDLDYEEWINCSKGSVGDSRWWDLFCADDECKYSSFISPILYNKGIYDEQQDLYFYINFVTAVKDPYDQLILPEYGICDEIICDRHEEEFHHFEFKVTGRYCCPEGMVWSRDFQSCCADKHCTDIICNDEGGTWLYGECWFLGNGGESCNTVCEGHNMYCKNPDDWTTIPEDCTLHEEVFKTMGLFPVPFNCNNLCLKNLFIIYEFFSPYYDGGGKCRYKTTSATYPFDKYLCTGVVPGGKPRICACGLTDCVDSDGGLNYFTKGTVTEGPTDYDDECDSGTVTEYFCGETAVGIKEYDCPNGCNNEACIGGQHDTGNCRDTDGGKNYFTLGNAWQSLGGFLPDYCAAEEGGPSGQGDWIMEWYCDGGTREYEYYKCPKGCESGACVE